MKQLMLLDVPKGHPSHQERLDDFKRRHGIETHKGPVDPPWLACHMPTARTFGHGVTKDSDLFDCMAKVCRLLDEAGVISEADTEREAVEQVCANMGIVFDL